jgi:hypothetical protein
MKKSRGGLVSPNRPGDFAGIIDMGENVGLGKDPAESLDDVFPAAHGGQPVMDDCHAHARLLPRDLASKLFERLCRLALERAGLKV